MYTILNENEIDFFARKKYHVRTLGRFGKNDKEYDKSHILNDRGSKFWLLSEKERKSKREREKIARMNQTTFCNFCPVWFYSISHSILFWQSTWACTQCVCESIYIPPSYKICEAINNNTTMKTKWNNIRRQTERKSVPINSSCRVNREVEHSQCTDISFRLLFSSVSAVVLPWRTSCVTQRKELLRCRYVLLLLLIWLLLLLLL